MEIVLRAASVFFFLWLVVRASGRRQLSEMTAFELVVLVTIGDLVQQGVTQEDMSLVGAVLAVGTLTLLATAASYLTFRSPRVQRVFEGVPVLVIRDGEVFEDLLHTERISDDELLEAAREHGVDDLARVRFAVLEPDGRFSFVTEGEAQEPEERHAG